MDPNGRSNWTISLAVQPRQLHNRLVTYGSIRRNNLAPTQLDDKAPWDAPPKFVSLGSKEAFLAAVSNHESDYKQ